MEQHNRATPEQLEKARAEGRAIAEGPVDVALLQKAKESLDANRPGIWRAFNEELIVAVREVPERRAAWAGALEGAFASAREALSTKVLDKREARELEGVSQEWREKRDPFAVWSGRDPHISFWREGVWSLGPLLIQIQPKEGLRALDTLPYPGVMKEVLRRFCHEDRDLIEVLVLAAPVAFDEQRTWVPERSFAALLVTDLITKHAGELHDAVSYSVRASGPEAQKHAAQQELEDVEQRVLPSWMRRAFGLLLQRKDGLHIALGYLGHLSREKLLGRGLSHDGEEKWTAPAVALDALAATLKDAAVRVRQVREAWKAAEQIAIDTEEADSKRSRVRRRSDGKTSDREGEGARWLHGQGLPFLCGATALLGDEPTGEAELDAFWAWFEELLDGRDPGLRLVNHGNSHTTVPRHFGYYLSRLPDPEARFRATYDKIEPQRRRALFASRYDELDHDLESVILLRVGLNAAANWRDRVKQGEQADAARAFFFWIYDTARRLWLTAVLDTGDTKRQLVSTCFAYMPILFGEGLGEALKQVIPPIANDARLLAEACVSLRLNHIEVARLRALIAEAGADLPASLCALRRRSELNGREEDFPEHLRKLEADLAEMNGAPAGGGTS